MFEGLKILLRPFRPYRALRGMYLFATNRGFRGDYLLLARRPQNLFQFRSQTEVDRYPGIFAFVRDRLAGVRQPRLLSFGCSTGEEVFSLRHYFSDGIIKGVDINPRNVAVGQARLREVRDPGISFARQDSAAGEAPESYDAIFCLAVFQDFRLQNPAIRSCETYICFDAFAATLDGLARCLKPGGFLALRYANFRFADTACSADFDAVRRIEPGGEPHPRFDRHNRRLPDEADAGVVFQKRRHSAAGPAVPSMRHERS